jgi:hypothetical protein
MAKTTKEIIEGFSFAGTFLFSQKADAEGVAAMLGLQGAFPMQTDEGLFWMPGKSYDELMNRIYSEWTVPDQATVPQAHSQKTLSFLAYLDNEGEQ